MTVWPQIVYLVLLVMGVGVALARYGEPKRPDSYDIVDVLIGPATMAGLLYAGGFFTVLGWAP